jgi:HEAT repeat protein
MEMKRPNPKTFAPVLLFLILAGSRTTFADTKSDEAWEIIRVNVHEKETAKRTQATRVLGLLSGDPHALELASKAVEDEKPEVRAAAATALGQLRSRSSISRLHALLSDVEPSVVLAAASALMTYKDPAAYDVYYEFLTGERKTGKGLIADQMKTLKDPKKMAELGVEEGIGFIPFAGIGLSAFQTLHVDDASPVRAAAAKMLATDPDPGSGQALVNATSDKSWVVKTAALEAIAKRGDPQLLDGILPAMKDDNTSVRCTAAAAVIRLSALAAAKTAKEKGTAAIAK